MEEVGRRDTCTTLSMHEAANLKHSASVERNHSSICCIVCSYVLPPNDGDDNTWKNVYLCRWHDEAAESSCRTRNIFCIITFCVRSSTSNDVSRTFSLRRIQIPTWNNKWIGEYHMKTIGLKTRDSCVNIGYVLDSEKKKISWSFARKTGE